MKVRFVALALAIVTALGPTMLREAQAQSAHPDPAKWNNSGFIRIFEMNGGKLLSGAYRQGGFDNGASTFSTRNDMRFLNPNSVQTIEATVTLLDASAVGTGFTISPRAGLEGHFYWDGTGTGSSADQTGHVFAGVNLFLSITTGSTGAGFFVIKCTSPDCSTFTLLASDSLATVNFFEPHRLRIDYDGTRFSFSLDSNPPVTFTPTDTTRNPPTVRFKTLRTRLRVPADPAASASVLALFEDISVNGLAYETFDDKTLPRVTIMPGSGTFISTQVADVAIVVESGGRVVTAGKLTFDGADISELLGSFTIGNLTTGGVTARLGSLAATAIPAGQHVVGVEVTFDDGTEARGYALWNVLETIEP